MRFWFDVFNCWIKPQKPYYMSLRDIVMIVKNIGLTPVVYHFPIDGLLTLFDRLFVFVVFNGTSAQTDC